MRLKRFLNKFQARLDRGLPEDYQAMMNEAYVFLTDEDIKELASIFKKLLNIDLYRYQYAELEDQVLNAALPAFNASKSTLLSSAAFSRLFLNNQLGLSLSALEGVLVSNLPDLARLGFKIHISNEKEIYIEKIKLI